MDEPVRDVLANRGVTHRELDVLGGLGARLTNAEIGCRLGMSERTVESHVSSLLRKLDARGRAELARFATGDATVPIAPGDLPAMVRLVRGRSPCFGREPELELLQGCWRSAAARTVVAVVRGEAGIGKSRLVAELAAEVHRGGGRVLHGSCTEGSPQPYEPFVRAFTDDVPLLHESTAPDPEHGRSTPRSLFGGAATPLPEDAIDAGHEIAQLQRTLRDHLCRLAADRRLLLVLEDLHWASDASLAVIAHIAESTTAPMLVVATARDEGPALTGSSLAYFGRLARLPTTVFVTLGGLDVAAAAQLIDAAGGSGVDAEDGVRHTGGNPLFLRELAREGLRSRTLRELVAARDSVLSADAIDVADVAAVAGSAIDAALLAEALERDVDEVLDALEDIERAGIIQADERPGWFVFVHDVYRGVRTAALPSGRAMRLHAALARALDSDAHGAGALAAAARHACLAGPRFDPSRAAELARRAGDAAVAATDHGQAAEHYRHALGALAFVPRPDEQLRQQLVTSLGTSLILIGDHTGRAMLRAAALAAGRAGDAAGAAAAICATSIIPGGGDMTWTLDAKVHGLIEQLLGSLPDEDEWRIRLLAVVGVRTFLDGDGRAGMERVDDAIGAARRRGDPMVLGRALLSARLCGTPFDLDRKMAIGRELIELGDRTGHAVFESVGRQQLCWCHRELGDLDEMARWDRSAAEHVRGFDFEQSAQAVAAALLQGDLDRADELTGTFADVTEHDARESYLAPIEWMISTWRGFLPPPEEVRAAIAAGNHPRTRSLWPSLTWTLARTGLLAEALVELRSAPDLADVDAFGAFGWTMALSELADAAAICSAPDVAADIADLLQPLTGRLADNGLSIWDSIDRVRALATLTAGDAAGAAQLAHRAVAASRRRGTPLLLGRELVVLAASSVGSQLHDAVTEARAIARRTGAGLIDLDIRLLVGRQAAAGPNRLTSREREILDRVGAGATNGQIARALTISPATVRKHLEHAFRKLDVSTRTAAVAKLAALRGAAPAER